MPARLPGVPEEDVAGPSSKPSAISAGPTIARDFEGRCRKDVIPAEALELYTAHRRELRIGRSPSLLAIDLYKLVYRGGDRDVRELVRTYPGVCGESVPGCVRAAAVVAELSSRGRCGAVS